MTSHPQVDPTYTFVSVSTAKPGKLQELAALASRPGELMDEKIHGVIARQVGIDKERNSVVVWVTVDSKETVYDYLATEEGKEDHGENEDMSAILDTFEMWDLVPFSGRLHTDALSHHHLSHTAHDTHAAHQTHNPHSPQGSLSAHHPWPGPTYTFVSVSTAKPGKLQELAALASRPGELMDEKLDGVIARQVGIDKERNSVVVWVTLDHKKTMDDYLATEEGKRDHGEDIDMSAIIDTFKMYDLVPYSGRF